jgi:hypothetical protein
VLRFRRNRELAQAALRRPRKEFSVDRPANEVNVKRMPGANRPGDFQLKRDTIGGTSPAMDNSLPAPVFLVIGCWNDRVELQSDYHSNRRRYWTG